MSTVRRFAAPLTLLAAAGLVAGACSGPPTTGAGQTPAAGTNAGEATLPNCPLVALDHASGPVRITLWYGGLAGETKATMDDVVRKFNASQRGVRLMASDQGTSYDQLYRKYASASAGSKDQLPDLIYTEDTQLQAMVNSGNVLPAQACMKAAGYDPTNLNAAVRAKYTVGGVLYPGYMNVSTPVLYYNKAHWVRAGLDPSKPPQTLDQLYTQARKLKAAGVSDQPLALVANRWYFDTWLNGIGEDIVNHGDGRDGLATRATFDTPQARKLLELLQKMKHEGLLNVFADTEGSIDQYLALVQQKSSMLIETSAASTTIAQVLGGNVTPEEAGIQFDSSKIDTSQLVPGSGPFPGIDAPGKVLPSGGAFYILNTSEPAQQAASSKFLQFMLRPAVAKEWHLKGGYLPIVKSVDDEPDVRAFWKDNVGGVLVKTAVDQLATADPDKPGPLIGPYPDEKTAVEGAMEAVLLNGQKVAPALASAQDEVTQSLERYAGD